MEIQSVDETEHEAEDVAVDMSKLLLVMNKRLEGMASSAGEPKLYTIFRVPDSIRCEKIDEIARAAEGVTTVLIEPDVSERSLVMKKRLADLPGSAHLPGRAREPEPYTIFRVPYNIRRGKPYYFDPTVVSIGPYHHSNPKYHAMEEQKWRFLRDFLSQYSDRINLETCYEAIAALEGRARRCYSEPIKLSSNAFVEMMLLDACFIVEFSLKAADPEHWSVMKEVGWSHEFVTNDLILLENQIPFFIIEELLKLAFPDNTERASRQLREVITQWASNLQPQSTHIEPYHLLHVCHHCFVPDVERREGPNWKPSILLRLYSCLFTRSAVQLSQSSTILAATELQEAGIKFKKKESNNSFLDVTFKNGILEIPSIDLDDRIKVFFMNLIAFEQCFRADNMHLTAFLAFMDYIINSKEDIMILEKSEIIKNFLSGEEEAAMFFNHIGQGVTFDDDDYLASLYADVHNYYSSTWHRHQANLARVYFGGPWVTISFFAGVVLLLVTILTAIFSVLLYVHPPK